MKNLQRGLRLFLALVAVMTFAVMACAEETVFQTLGEIETLVYGQEIQGGGLVARLGQVEKDLFGRELPGSLSERQQSLLSFLKQGTPVQPSFLFKLGVAEWAVHQEIRPRMSASERIGDLEKQLEGSVQEGKPLAMRLERLSGMLLPEPVTGRTAEVPAQLVFKVELGQTLSAKTAKAGDPVMMKLAGDLTVGDLLVAPKGSLVIGHVDSVKPPRSFGRKAEVRLAFDNLLPLGPDPIAVFMGEQARKAAKADESIVAAAGASFLGLILLGPVGLAGGLLVRGDATVLQEGTPFYLETSTATSVMSYPVPKGLKGMLNPVETSLGQPVPGDMKGETKP
jgi:hypothetical protein